MCWQQKTKKQKNKQIRNTTRSKKEKRQFPSAFPFDFFSALRDEGIYKPGDAWRRPYISEP
jgi:hypothetical protein